MTVDIAAKQGRGLKAGTIEHPDARSGHVIDAASRTGDQFGGFMQRVAGAVALARQAHDQALLGMRALLALLFFTAWCGRERIAGGSGGYQVAA
jgi:hypothetical protein